MSGLKDRIKEAVRKELVGGGLLSGSKYRIGTVTNLNADGTCLAMLDGNAVVAFPLYPVVQGQEVMLVFGEGKISAIPTKPNTPQVDIIHPPFFSGGGTRFASDFTNVGFRPAGIFPPNTVACCAFQDAGSTDVYLLFIPNANGGLYTGQYASNNIKSIRAHFSPSGLYVGILTILNGPIGTQNQDIYDARSYRLGSRLASDGNVYQTKGVAGAINNVFGLHPNLLHTATRTDAVSVSDGSVTVIQDVAVDNSGELFFIEAVHIPPQTYLSPSSIPPAPPPASNIGVVGPDGGPSDPPIIQQVAQRLTGFAASAPGGGFGGTFHFIDTNTLLGLQIGNLNDPNGVFGGPFDFGADYLHGRLPLSGPNFNDNIAPGFYLASIDVGNPFRATVQVALMVYSTPGKLQVNLFQEAGLLLSWNVPRQAATHVDFFNSWSYGPINYQLFGNPPILIFDVVNDRQNNLFLIAENFDQTVSSVNPQGVDILQFQLPVGINAVPVILSNIITSAILQGGSPGDSSTLIAFQHSRSSIASGGFLYNHSPTFNDPYVLEAQFVQSGSVKQMIAKAVFFDPGSISLYQLFPPGVRIYFKGAKDGLIQDNQGQIRKFTIIPTGISTPFSGLVHGISPGQSNDTIPMVGFASAFTQF